MGIKPRDLSGEVFGRLTAIRRVIKKGGGVLWECQCSCGSLTVATASNIIKGNTKSCGCLAMEWRHYGKRTHGLSGTSILTIWRRMRERCYVKSDPAYPNYGGRGIRMCDRWLESPTDFAADMGARPSPKHSVDRIDNNGNYEPSNCRWATRAQQNNNRRDNILVTLNGETLTIIELAKRTKINEHTLRERLHRGLPMDQVISPYDQRTGATIRATLRRHDGLRLKGRGRMRTFEEFQDFSAEKFQGDIGLPVLVEFLGGWDAAVRVASQREIDEALRMHFLNLAAPQVCAQLLLDAMGAQVKGKPK